MLGQGWKIALAVYLYSWLAALESRIVSERLVELGYTKDEIQSRLDRPSDQQLHKAALKIDELKVRGLAREL